MNSFIKNIIQGLLFFSLVGFVPNSSIAQQPPTPPPPAPGVPGDLNAFSAGIENKLPLQVFLEVNIFEVMLRNSDEIGFIYDVLGQVGEFRGTNLGGSDTIESDLNVLGKGVRNALLPSGANIAAAVFQGDNGEVQMLFQALAEDRIVRVHANPIILTVEGVPARIKAGDEIPYLARVSIGGYIQTVVSNSQQTGVEMTITPTVNYMDMDVEKKKPYITVDVFANLSSVTRFRQEEGYSQPIVDTRQYTTSVSLKEGERILIGGLFRDSKVKNERGVPIMRDIPLLGRLFRNTVKTQSVSQLFIMIRPMVLDIWKNKGNETQFMDSDSFKESRQMFDKAGQNMQKGSNPFEDFRELMFEHDTSK